MSNRITLACSLAMLSLAVSAEPVTYTQCVPASGGHVTVEVTVDNGDFKMVKLLPAIAAPQLTPGVNATNQAEFDSLTEEEINLDDLKGVLTEALRRAAAEEPDPGFVPGTYRTKIISEKDEIAIEFVIKENGVGDVKILDKKPAS